MDAIVGEGHAKKDLVEVYAIPTVVVDRMTQQVATRLYWKLVYSDVISALQTYHESDAQQPNFVASARVVFIHPQNGLGNRLRALASGLAIARATLRVPVVVWERDAHLGAGLSELFQTSWHGSDMATVLFKDLIFMESFPQWNAVKQRESHWHPVNYMEKDRGGAMPGITMRFDLAEGSKSIPEPNHWIGSVGDVPNVTDSSVTLMKRDVGDATSKGDLIDQNMHVYFKSAYVASTSPAEMSSKKSVNTELRTLRPSRAVLDIVSQIDAIKLTKSVGVHIRSRSLADDNVSVNANCEYTTFGARITDYWRSRSQIPVFIDKMRWAVGREKRLNFFVAADDIQTVSKLEAAFPGRIHSIPRSCDDRNDSCVLYAMADLICLSKTRKIYGSNWSSFSESASRLGRKPVFLSGRDFGKGKKLQRWFNDVRLKAEAKIREFLRIDPFRSCEEGD